MPRFLLAPALGILLLAGCASTPPPPPPRDQVSQPPEGRAACRAGADAKGIAAGFFALFQDRPECF